MQHLHHVSKTPKLAQGICDELGSPTQAKFCFVITLLQSFVLPVIEIKEPDNGGNGGDDGNGDS